MRYWLIPLQTTCDEIYEAGWLIERLIEPRPVPSAERVNAEQYALLQIAPGFVAFRLLPRA